MLVLDTHALVWWATDPDRLGRKARADIDASERLGVPAIAFWEVSLLVRKGKLELDMPVQAHLEFCDKITFWTWEARNLERLEENAATWQALAANSRRVLGCYMWDYGGRQPMPLGLMERQCELGRQWLRQGRIHGLIFLASCICDLELEAVEWTRRWLQTVGDEPLP